MAADEPDVRTLEVRGWLLRASEDLRAGKHDLTARPPLCNDVAFHAQQCAEKAMKAFLVYHERPFRKTHNLTELARSVPGSKRVQAGTTREVPGTERATVQVDAVEALARRLEWCRVPCGYKGVPSGRCAAPSAWMPLGSTT